jgi:hypothetical protein
LTTTPVMLTVLANKEVAMNMNNNIRPVTLKRNVDKITPKRRKCQIGVLVKGKLVRPRKKIKAE